MSSTLPISGPLSLGDLLDRAFRLYRARFWPMTLVGAIFVVPIGIITGLLTGQSMTGYMDAIQAMNDTTPSSDALLEMFGSLGSIFAIILGSSILLGLASAIAQLALTAQSMATLHGETLTLGSSVSRGIGRLLPFIGMSVVQTLTFIGATIAVFIPIILLLFLTGVGAGLTGNGSDSGALVGVALLCVYCIGFPLAIIPSIYLSARWIVALPSLFDGAGPVGALGQSWRLTKGQVWRTVGYLILLGLLSALVTGIPVYTIQQLVALGLGPERVGLATGIGQGLGSIANVLWMPLNVAAIVLLYYDLRVRQEGYDVALRIQQLETGTTPPAPTLPESGSND